MVFVLVFFVVSSAVNICLVQLSTENGSPHHKNDNNKTMNDSWMYYSFQIFNQNEKQPTDPESNHKNLTPSETLLYHGYIPPVNHLEDYHPPLTTSSPSDGEAITDTEPIIASHKDEDYQQQPGSIQDLLVPAEADQSHTTDQERDPSEETGSGPDDDEDFGPEPEDPDDDDEENQPIPQYAALQDEEQASNDDIMARRVDDDDYDFDYDDENNRADRDELRILSDNEPDDIEREDFSDGGETQKIDQEIIIPQIFLWSDPIQLSGESNENDFDLDEGKFDKEYSTEETRMNIPIILEQNSDTNLTLGNLTNGKV